MLDNKEHQQRQALRAAGKALALDLLLNRGLYSSIPYSEDVEKEAHRQIYEADVGTFDCFCTACRRVTSFISQKIPVKNVGGGLRHGNAILYPPSVFALRTVCQRDLTTYIYAFQNVGDHVIKIGQQPSMADISFGELKDIDQDMVPIDRKELGTALGLFAHDATAGAFVYLRRVFERMIGRAHERSAGLTVEEFNNLRMDEKISALKEILPDRIVKNRSVFSILSRGVHELTDDQCKTLFPLVKAVIFQMLEQEEHQRKKKLTELETDAALQAALASGIGLTPEPDDTERTDSAAKG